MPNLNRKLFVAGVFIVVLVAGMGIARADVKISSRQTMSGQTYQNTVYIKGKRQRTESMNGQMVVIQQCDLRRDLQLMPSAAVYKVTRYDEAAGSQSNPNLNGPVAPRSKGGVITSTVTTRDTGERKQMFGYTARHMITTMVMTSSPDACTQVNSKMEFDGWYIDAAFVLECDWNRNPYTGLDQSAGGCQDRYETKQAGAAKRGYPVYEKTTMYGPNGEVSFTSTTEVTDISQAALEASLFDAPADYREVQDFSQASMSGNGGNRPSSNAPASTSNRPTGGQSAPAPAKSNNDSLTIPKTALQLGKPW